MKILKRLSKSMMVKLHEGLGIPYENMMEVSASSALSQGDDVLAAGLLGLTGI